MSCSVPTKQQPLYDNPFVALDPKTMGCCWCLTSNLQEAFFSISVLQLNCPNFAQVEQVSVELQPHDLQKIKGQKHLLLLLTYFPISSRQHGQTSQFHSLCIVVQLCRYMELVPCRLHTNLHKTQQ
uniref:Uncharacterized protein n=1 Tax=Zea mays TaxID=4577 RepID=B4FH71_MAIZE|nr:unknown [Zea mays]